MEPYTYHFDVGQFQQLPIHPMEFAHPGGCTFWADIHSSLPSLDARCLADPPRAGQEIVEMVYLLLQKVECPFCKGVRDQGLIYSYTVSVMCALIFRISPDSHVTLRDMMVFKTDIVPAVAEIMRTQFGSAPAGVIRYLTDDE